MNQVLMIVMAVGAVLGGADRLRGNKWGFGDKFETGFMLMGSMAPLEDALEVVASICVVLLGSLPMAELLRRCLVRPFAWAGDRLGMRPQSLTGMLVGMVSAIPALSMFKDMDSRGKVAVGAFLVSDTSLLAAHVAFPLSTEPALLPAVLAAKLAGALAAVLLALAVK